MKKIFLILGLIAFLAAPIYAQGVFELKSSTSQTLDTVTNTATNTLTSPAISGNSLVSAVINVTKISGTVGGTISLLGSLDGTIWDALNTVETQTALATITAADASGVYSYRLSGNHFRYYRVSWTGTGTMAASFSAKLYLK